MRISRKKFYLITLMFLLLPLSANYRLILFGKKATGVVVAQEKDYSNSEVIYCIIHFEANGKSVEFNGPEHLKYPIGKQVTIYYNKRKPHKFIMFNFAGLVLNNNKMIIPGVLLIMWFAFYLAIRDSQPKKLPREKLSRYKKAIEENS